MTKLIQNIIYLLLILALAFFSYLMLQICLQYIPIHLDVAFLRIKQNVVHLPHYQVAFFTHVFTSMFSILAGATQFSATIRIKYTKVHRVVGFVYFISIILFAAPSGFVLAIYANGGWSSQLAFVLLSILWWTSSLGALIQVKNKKYILHEYLVYISYALTLSAITLRIWKFGIAHIFEPRPMDMYRIVAWLGWVPNLALALLIIYFKEQQYEKK